MEVTTEGIVLRRLPYTDSASILTVYTRKFGTTAFMARGISKKGGPVSKSALAPLTPVEAVCTFKENREMQTLRGLRARNGLTFFGESPQKAAVAMFLAEVLFKTLREEAPDEELFDFTDGAVAYFLKTPFEAHFHLVFLMHLTRYFGFFPSGKYGPESPYFDLTEGSFTDRPPREGEGLDPERAAGFYGLCMTRFGEKPSGLDNARRRRLLADLMHYYHLHLEGMGKIKSLDVLTEVFS